MKNFRALALVYLLALEASAGENKYLGVLSSAGTTINNGTTAAPFVIPPNSKITMHCSAAVFVYVDNATTATSGATKGVPVGASTLFPTSVQGSKIVISSVLSAVVAMIPSSGSATCDVWQRDGAE